MFYRLCLTAIVLANKMYFEPSIINKESADFGGVDLDHLNELEKILIQLLDYRLMVSSHIYKFLRGQFNSFCYKPDTNEL